MPAVRASVLRTPFVKAVLSRIFSLPQVIMFALTLVIAFFRQREGVGGSSSSCFDCGRYFPSPILLSLHVQTRPGEVRTKCTACGRCYKHRSGNLKQWKQPCVSTIIWRSVFGIICTNIHFLFNVCLNERFWNIFYVLLMVQSIKTTSITTRVKVMLPRWTETIKFAMGGKSDVTTKKRQCFSEIICTFWWAGFTVYIIWKLHICGRETRFQSLPRIGQSCLFVI